MMGPLRIATRFSGADTQDYNLITDVKETARLENPLSLCLESEAKKPRGETRKNARRRVAVNPSLSSRKGMWLSGHSIPCVLPTFHRVARMARSASGKRKDLASFSFFLFYINALHDPTFPT